MDRNPAWERFELKIREIASGKVLQTIEIASKIVLKAIEIASGKVWRRIATVLRGKVWQ